MPAYIPKKESCTTPPAHYRYRRGNNLKLEHLRTTYVAHTASSRRMQQRLDSALTSVDGMLDEAADLSRSLNGLTSENRVLSCMSQFIELSPAIEASPVHLYEREKPPPSPKRPLRKSTVSSKNILIPIEFTHGRYIVF